MTEEFADSSVALVAEVNCQSDGRALCERNGVAGYPTILQGDPLALKEYEGDRDYDSLKQFASDKLRGVCTPANIEHCDEEKAELIRSLQALTTAELKAKVQDAEGQIKAYEDKFEKHVEDMRKRVKEMEAEKAESFKVAEEKGFGFMKAIKTVADSKKAAEL